MNQYEKDSETQAKKAFTKRKRIDELSQVKIIQVVILITRLSSLLRIGMVKTMVTTNDPLSILSATSFCGICSNAVCSAGF
jgi:hypothetical protein